jgi:NADPH:quinone reductase
VAPNFEIGAGRITTVLVYHQQIDQSEVSFIQFCMSLLPIQISRSALRCTTALASQLSSRLPASTQLSLRRMASNIPKTMNAIVVEQNGGPEQLQYKPDYPTPSPEKDQLLVKNEIIGINFIDTYFRTGLYPLSSKPAIIGQEAAGTVVAVGPGSNSLGFNVGDRVIWMKFGAYAEYSAVPWQKTIKIPEGLSSEDAIGGFLMGMTALALVEEAYRVQKGDWVMLHAAAGGVGLLMCQLLKARGARTIATAGGPEKCELAKKNGADHVVDHKNPDGPKWLDEVKRLTNDEGVAVVYDSVGKDTWEDSLEAARRKGKVVFFGNASGPVPPFPIARLSAKNISVIRPTLFNYTTTREEFEHYANELFRLVQSGELRIRIHDTYKLENAAQAHRDLEARKTTGKLLLRP